MKKILAVLFLFTTYSAHAQVPIAPGQGYVGLVMTTEIPANGGALGAVAYVAYFDTAENAGAYAKLMDDGFSYLAQLNQMHLSVGQEREPYLDYINGFLHNGVVIKSWGTTTQFGVVFVNVGNSHAYFLMTVGPSGAVHRLWVRN